LKKRRYLTAHRDLIVLLPKFILLPCGFIEATSGRRGLRLDAGQKGCRRLNWYSITLAAVCIGT
jgi:hypothetical protein